MEDPDYQTGLQKVIQAGLLKGRREFGFSWYGTHDELIAWLYNIFPTYRHIISISIKHPDTYHLFFEDIGDFSNKAVNGFTPSISLIGHQNQGYKG